MYSTTYSFVFVNYSGYPDYMEYLFAENGLAYLSGILRSRGHRCTVLDYVTLSVAERLYPSEYMHDVARLRVQSLHQIVEHGSIRKELLAEIRDIEGLIDERNRRVATEILQELLAYITDNQVNCVGFKLWSQPALRDLLYIAKGVRNRFPDLLIIGGGAHVDFFMTNAFSSADGCFDFLVYGDGEVAVEMIPGYLGGSVSIEEIPNIIYRNANGEIAVNPEQRIKHLRYSVDADFDVDTYPAMGKQSEKVKLIPLENARGCNFHCGFCIHPIKSGQYREKQPEEFIEEIYSLKKRHGFINFYGAGSNTTHHNCMANLRKIYDRGNEVVLSFFQSTRDFSVDSGTFLSIANVGFFWIGVETSSQVIAASEIGNRKSIAQLEAVCMMLKQIGIRAYTSYIYPLPGSTEEVARDTLTMIRKLDSEWIVIYPPLLQPRTKWFGGNTHIRFMDREGFITASMYGIEEIENKVLPPIVTDDRLAESVVIDNRNYRDIYFEYLRFKYLHDSGSSIYAHQYKVRAFLVDRPMNRLYALTDRMTDSVMKALTAGQFDLARRDLEEYNKFCTSGSFCGK